MIPHEKMNFTVLNQKLFHEIRKKAYTPHFTEVYDRVVKQFPMTEHSLSLQINPLLDLENDRRII